jgi:hypothetical protein
MFLMTGLAYGQNEVDLASFQVRNSDGDVLVRWKAEVEQGLEAYVLKRRTPYTNGVFKKVERIAAHGASKAYTYRDAEVYKSSSERVRYRLGVVFQDGTERVMDTETVNYKPTAVRRTWGSIKAMFQ